MLAAERRRRIVQMVQDQGSVQIAQVADGLNVSAMTVRRDLDCLAAEHAIVRTHGGAVLRGDDIREFPLKMKQGLHSDAKAAIAREATKLIGAGQSVIIDAGSTNLRMASALKDFRDLLVITNDVKVAMELGESEGVELLLVGGHLKRGVYSLEGHYSESFLSGLYVDTAFIGCDAFSLQRGVMTNSLTKVSLKKVMLSSSQRRVLMADSSKVERWGTASFADLETFHVLVTDDRISSEFVEACQNLGIEVVVARTNGAQTGEQAFHSGG